MVTHGILVPQPEHWVITHVLGNIRLSWQLRIFEHLQAFSLCVAFVCS